jgi:hypothetical protein
MMSSEHFHGAEPHEVELGRAMLALAALLDREMNAIFQDILLSLADDDRLERQRATAANRVVLLCRDLADQLRHYEHLRWLVDSGESLQLDDCNF